MVLASNNFRPGGPEIMFFRTTARKLTLSSNSGRGRLSRLPEYQGNSEWFDHSECSGAVHILEV